MNVKYSIVIGIIIFQFSLIALVILTSLASNLIVKLKEKKQKKEKVDLEKYLIQSVKQKSTFSSLSFKWPSLDILLFVVKKLDDQLSDQAWGVIRVDLLHSIILPLARKAVTSNNWADQFYAAQVFELYAEESDKELITTLINSKMPIVRLAALRAAILYGSEQAINDLIHEIQDLPRLSQSIYIQAFSNAPINTRPYVAKLLNKTSNINTRLTCYRILLSYPFDQIDWTVNNDIHSVNLNIKLAALRLLAYTQKENAIPILLENLTDKNWEVKVISLNALNDLKVNSVIPQIAECLHDESWWVSLTAAKTLKNMGEKGELALSKASISLDPKAYIVARHVLLL